MHKLDRDPVPPAGLNRYRQGVNSWGDGCPTSAERQAIWEKLNAMQGDRCAYCEAKIVKSNRHIEHFRQRSRFPGGTFAWDNLFGSCSRTDCCGKYKDSCGRHNPADLVKPDTEDPEHFLVFARNGAVSPRKRLSVTETRRATETIRVFNLNGVLSRIRLREISGYVQTAEEFAKFAEHFPENDWLPLLQEELESIAQLPFATAIRHILTRQSD